MHIRIVDYIGNSGGGVRFTVEGVKALALQHPEARLEFISYGRTLSKYRTLFAAEGISIECTGIAPKRYWHTRGTWLALSLAGTGRMKKAPAILSRWHYDLAESIFQGCDVVWLPWIHWHRVPVGYERNVVASLHDVIILQTRELLKDDFPAHLFETERETLRRWLASEARIVVSSRATIAALDTLFAYQAARLFVVTILGDHARKRKMQLLPADWNWAEHPFLLCPANIMSHKNHEVLLQGVAAWECKHPLVLSGEGTQLAVGEPRAARLRRFASSLGLEIGTSLFPLGYLSNNQYYSLLNRAWAVVMPTLAEGGGSFPVLEAMLSGIPVLCSDIPVMREQIALTRGQVLWFDPHDPHDLADKLHELEARYDWYKAEAIRQVPELRNRSWAAIADDYWSIFTNNLAVMEVRGQQGGIPNDSD